MIKNKKMIASLKAIKLRCKDCQPERKERTETSCIGCQLKSGSRNPLKRIQKYCRDFCCHKQGKEAQFCPDTKCSLYPYRFKVKKGKN